MRVATSNFANVAIDRVDNSWPYQHHSSVRFAAFELAIFCMWQYASGK
jgi:hypothetical protein